MKYLYFGVVFLFISCYNDDSSLIENSKDDFYSIEFINKKDYTNNPKLTSALKSFELKKQKYLQSIIQNNDL